MRTLIQCFLKSENGAVTVDWVVLTAAVVGLGVAAIAAASLGINGIAGVIGSTVSGTSLGS